MRIELTSAFTPLSVSEGTLQNGSLHALVEVATDTTENSGIVLKPGEIMQIKSNVGLYARSIRRGPSVAETPYLVHEPFKGSGGGGDSTASDRKPSTAYDAGQLATSPTLASGLVLRCTTAGTTSSAALDCSGYELGDTITDGTAEWLVVSYAVSTGDAFYIGPDGNWCPSNADVIYSAYFAEGADGNLYPLEGGV